MRETRVMYIGLTGNAGAGKTSIAKYIQSKFIETNPNSYVLISPFAGPLKQFARDLGWDGNKDEKGRRLLQLLGTEVGRNCINDNIWINKWKEHVQTSIEKINNLDDQFPARNILIIVDDLRFDNEASYLKSIGAKIYYLANRAYEDVDNTHDSEKGIDAKYIDGIFNSGYMTLDELEEAVYNEFNRTIKGEKNK